MSFSSGRHRGLRLRAARLIKRAARARRVLVTAESCTAGELVSLLALAPGSADVLAGGFVVYTKASKALMLGVPRAMLRRHTAVSAQVAAAMARGALRRAGADVAVAITGVAGPRADKDGNPVGLGYVATATRRGGAACRQLAHRSRNPERNLLALHDLALAMLSDALGC
jgi:nicotinamide-nucleotide amidase